MFIINGILENDMKTSYTNNDGSIVNRRIAYIRPKNGEPSFKVRVDDPSLVLGVIGHEVVLDIDIYPYYFENQRMKKAEIVCYISKK